MTADSQHPIGTSDFVQLRRAGKRYIDKIGFIVEVMRANGQVILLLRPCRFGKTLGLSTLAAYLERPAPQTAKDAPQTAKDAPQPDRAELFQDLAVWQAGDDIRAHFRRYPVIFLTFEGVNPTRWSDCRAAIAALMAQLYRQHQPVFTDHLSVYERRDVDALLGERADDITLSRSLAELSRLLRRATGERAVILIDDHDTPMAAAVRHGYHQEAGPLLDGLLSAALKDNAHLQRGVIAGVLSVIRGSIFSGLNNLVVYTLLSTKFSQHFGFTPEEVALLAQEYGLKAGLIQRQLLLHNFKRDLRQEGRSPYAEGKPDLSGLGAPRHQRHCAPPKMKKRLGARRTCSHLVQSPQSATAGDRALVWWLPLRRPGGLQPLVGALLCESA